jgi:hypothetical protein
MVVSLEPCNHQGRTPPCVPIIVEAGIRRVLVGTRDPNPASGRGLDALREAGVEVAIAAEEGKARHLVAGFASLLERQRPRFFLKIAASRWPHRHRLRGFQVDQLGSGPGLGAPAPAGGGRHHGGIRHRARGRSSAHHPQRARPQPGSHRGGLEAPHPPQVADLDPERRETNRGHHRPCPPRGTRGPHRGEWRCRLPPGPEESISDSGPAEGAEGYAMSWLKVGAGWPAPSSSAPRGHGLGPLRVFFWAGILWSKASVFPAWPAAASRRDPILGRIGSFTSCRNSPSGGRGDGPCCGIIERWVR